MGDTAYVLDCYGSTHVADVDMLAIEGNFAAIRNNFIATAAPSSYVAGQFWFDSNSTALKLRDPGNSTWLTVVTAAGGEQYHS